MYFGTYERQLDEKGRLQLPTKLVKEEVRTLFILKGFEGCISVYEGKSFEELVERLSSMDYFDKTKRDFVRQASASIVQMDIDSHGRILLGKAILDSYSIGNDVTLIGVLDHFEIWDTKAYGAYKETASKSYDLGGASDGQ